MPTSDRSMNADMRIGAVDGRLRFLRPNAVNAEMEERLLLAAAMERPYWGVTYGNIEAIRSALPGAVHPLAPIRIGKHEVVDPL